MKSFQAEITGKIKNVLNISNKREKNAAALCAAIKSMRVIEFYYHGSFRTVEPFCLGIVMFGKADNESLLCYQVAGADDLNEEKGWRLYRVSDMEEIVIKMEQFTGDRPNYKPDNLEFAKIICCVKVEAKSEAPTVDKPAAPAGEIPKAMPRPIVIPSGRPIPFDLTHNELMIRFRCAHPVPIPELYTKTWSGSLEKPVPESAELKNKPLKPKIDRDYVYQLTRP